MMIKSGFILALMSLPCMLSAEVLSGAGDPVNFVIGSGYTSNPGSSLTREWVIVNDDQLPVQMSRMRIETPWRSQQGWVYEINYSVEVSEPVVAMEVHFLSFDVWGDRLRTLPTTKMIDINGGTGKRFLERWDGISVEELGDHYTMLGYVAQVKLGSGVIVRANLETVVEAAQLFSTTFTLGDLATED
jgi:hypothetical protein